MSTSASEDKHDLTPGQLDHPRISVAPPPSESLSSAHLLSGPGSAPRADMNSRLLSSLALLPLAGCASLLVGPPDEDPRDNTVTIFESFAERDPRFVGTWLVDQPDHALYEASFYELEVGGAVTHLGTETFGGEPLEDFEVGLVQIEEACPNAICPTVVCRFGDRWRSAGDDTLLIDGVCDDGLGREIELRFVGDEVGNAVGLTQVDVARVGAATEGVSHPGFNWRFLKCLDEDGEPLSGSWGCEPLDQGA
jgi:hypothetical protein